MGKSDVERSLGGMTLPTGPLRPVRGTEGFTLVEALVVSMIVAILAAVAIPLYSGMVKSQRRDAAKNIAQAAATSANIYFRRYGVDPACTNSAPTCITVLGIFLPDPARYEVKITPGTAYVIVNDVSNGTADSVEAAAAFR